MRALSIPLLALLAAGTTACVGQQPAQNAGYNPGQWSPQAQWGQQPQWGPQSGPQPQWGQPQPQPWSPLPPPVYRPVNVPALLALEGRIPCAPKEVAPGTWATFDCTPFQAVQQAIQYIPFVRTNFLPVGPAPASVDHRVEGGEGPVKDQGAVGVCTAVSLSTAMDNAVRRMGRQDVISALHIWSNYGVPTMGSAGDSNLNKTVTVEQVWQYDPAKACKLAHAAMDTCTTAYGVASASESFDPQLKAEHARADASGRYRLAALEALHAKPADPAEMASVLAGGDDIWISFSVNDQAWMNRALQNGVIPDYEVVDDTGHAVVLAGYRTLPNGTKQFLVHNSWSTRWGDNGYGWISEAMVTRFTRAAYRVRVTDASGAPAPQIPGKAPSPGQAPAAGGCPDGQTKDPVFGMCVPGALPGVPGGIPGLPGLPLPGQSPAPSQPGSAPKAPQQGSCPQGQAPDMMNGQCANLCPGGSPTVGGMCLPIPK